MKNNITFQDIANYTGFSKTTISRYFNHPESISKENKEKISAALKDLNYKENKVAKILANGETEFIGLILPDMYNAFYSGIAEKIIKTYDEFGYKFIIFSGSDKEESERKYIEELLTYKIEGLIVLSHTLPSMDLASYGIPVVAIEREDRFISSVSTDNYMGGIQATSLLYKRDCNVLINLISQTKPDVPAYGRVQSFLDTCREHMLDYRIMEFSLGRSYEEMADSIRDVVNRSIIDAFPGKKVGIFCTSDACALIVLNTIIRHYGNLPEEYDIIGFDNIPASLESVIQLTTVGQQSDVIVSKAMHLISKLIEKKKAGENPVKPEHIIVPPKLIIRETTT